MLDDVFAQLRGLVKEWNQEAAQQRQITTANPVADTTAYRASELEGMLRMLEQDTEYLSPEDYAGSFPPSRRPTPQTVRNWIRTGRLKAILDDRGHYRIRREERPELRRTRRRRAGATR